MTPEYPTDPRQALEASLTALLLGELPPDQALFLREALIRDAELARMHERLKQTIELVRQTEAHPAVAPAAASEPLTLSAERRERLLEHFRTTSMPERAGAPLATRHAQGNVRPSTHSRPSWWLVAAAAVVLCFVGLSMFLPALSRAKSRGSSHSLPERALALVESALIFSSPQPQELLAVAGTQSGGVQSTPELAGDSFSLAGTAPRTLRSDIALPQQAARDGDETSLYSRVKHIGALREQTERGALNVETPKVTAGIPQLALVPRPQSLPAPAPVPPAEQLPETAQTPAAWGGFAVSGMGGGVAKGRPIDSLGGRVDDTAPMRRYSYLAAPPSGAVAGAKTVDTGTETRHLDFDVETSGAGFSLEDAKGLELRGKPVVTAPAQAAIEFKVPTLGDTPVLGRSLDSVNLIRKNDERKVARQVGVPMSGTTGPIPEPDAATRPTNPSHVFQANIVGYVNVSAAAGRYSLTATNAAAEIASKDKESVTAKYGKLTSGLRLQVADRKNNEDLRRKVESAGKAITATGEAENSAMQPVAQAAADVIAAKPVIPPPVPQPEIATAENAFSTFSLNVSDVSFKLAAVSLEKGVMPDPAAIRTEEFINAFDYRDPEPTAGMPVAFAWERARYPFAQNRDLLRFALKTAAQGRQAGRPLNLVLLVDNSGSMERADRVRILREALRVLATQLQPHDKLSVIAFSRVPHLWADGLAGNEAGRLAEEIAGLTPEGGTNLEEALKLAYKTAARHYQAAGVNRVVLLTDGAANLGDVNPEDLKKNVEAHRKQGIALDCFGIGWEGYNDDLLEVLSRNGDGRYGFINTPEEASTEFAGQLAGALRVAASDVKVQVEFNPNRVTAYRQIGYAKHQLTKEQFRDNTVDAAEIGAAESGNALYVVEVNPQGEGALATVRVRYKVPGTSDYHEHEWTVPYNGTVASLEQSSPAMRLAGATSTLAERLASSPYAAGVNLGALLNLMRGVPEVYGADARPQKLQWMIRQASSLAGE